ncbi:MULTISPECIES: CPBP family intramembrane glutamic endopeptidase [unclassified Paenibacillus]|uniref:CPBP family intramembrane glutamic endopeptidase n=1 Tax=unclassified Paenibacillus TaxID=185978 RepID=UPI001AE27C36|nr:MULTISPECIES: CPBP family intramembrane glutamic endopeptidase [unclassified Paenibacillus]MBP1154706.1 membrane protease YdiL (CAAX protease family) [Paenibacillus sp. PvP091]MBP1169910.1 membrane protease YdiL (CAAX protease family) [Paenibacillus sp. PvR098]MBP2440938.1 membrane protease YdiL (CAAX protease family) [Paenibacillus sp. PvP052]
MKTNDIFVVLIYLVLIGPRPTGAAIFDNKYYVAIAPLVAILLIYFCMRKEIQLVDWNEALKGSRTKEAFFKSLQYVIYAQAASTILFGSSVGLSDELIKTYILMPFYAIIVAPIAEELVYRKIIFGYLSKFTHFWIASGISSLIYAFGHFSWNRFIGYFLTGIIFCYFYKKTQSVIPTIAAHLVINFISLLILSLKL